MSKKASLEINGESFDLPVIQGTEQEQAINISNLRAATGGLITIDPGFKNTGSCQSAITFLDGEKGILRYRGYSIEELAEKADFLEVAFLLIFGELPSADELDKLHEDIKENSIVDDDIRKILDAFPKSAHPMGILSSLTSALTAFNPSNDQINNINYERSKKALYDNIVKVLGKIPVLVTW
ncbi:MAG: citrate/2-methylcitrate synthase, partial [Bacteroidota bacterium]|nr:citrate/2-methylcitrate synthase [Bacteroidota bacterium]